MLKIVLNFAVEEEWIELSPASKMRLLKTGEWRAWTDEECAAFEARWPQGSMQRRAYALAKYTGQRKSDLVLMTRADRKGGLLCVKQSKTDAEVHIPEHRELIAELTRGNSEHIVCSLHHRVRRSMLPILARGLLRQLKRRCYQKIVCCMVCVRRPHGCSQRLAVRKRRSRLSRAIPPAPWSPTTQGPPTRGNRRPLLS